MWYDCYTMNKTKENPLTKILLILGLLAAVIIFLVIDSRSFAPTRISRRTERLESEQIPRQLDNVRLLFFSDLEYGTFMNEKRLDSLCAAIANASPDIVVFGGDLFDYEAEAGSESVSLLKEKLKSIEAPLGKFAVLGDNDHKSEEMVTTVTDILTYADFEVLRNRSVLLHNRDSRAVTLLGLDNGLNGMQDIEAAYASVSTASYVITVCHTPDTASKVPADKTDYFLAGHSHGGQVYYFFGAYYTPAMATEYLRGRHTVGTDFTLDITSGVGTTGRDARMFANCEIVLYTFVSAAPAPTPTPTPTPKPSETPETTPSPTPEETEPTEETVPEETPEEEWDDSEETGEETWDDSEESWDDSSEESWDESGEETWDDGSGGESYDWSEDSGQSEDWSEEPQDENWN